MSDLNQMRVIDLAVIEILRSKTGNPISRARIQHDLRDRARQLSGSLDVAWTHEGVTPRIEAYNRLLDIALILTKGVAEGDLNLEPMYRLMIDQLIELGIVLNR